jgi:hypothetical protein
MIRQIRKRRLMEDDEDEQPEIEQMVMNSNETKIVYLSLDELDEFEKFYF